MPAPSKAAVGVYGGAAITVTNSGAISASSGNGVVAGVVTNGSFGRITGASRAAATTIHYFHCGADSGSIAVPRTAGIGAFEPSSRRGLGA